MHNMPTHADTMTVRSCRRLRVHYHTSSANQTTATIAHVATTCQSGDEPANQTTATMDDVATQGPVSDSPSLHSAAMSSASREAALLEAMMRDLSTATSDLGDPSCGGQEARCHPAAMHQGTLYPRFRVIHAYILQIDLFIDIYDT